MKNNKWLILILVAALLVAYYLIGSDYLKQRRQNASLTSQIIGTTQALALIPSPPADLAQRLAAAQDSLQAAESTFAADTNNTRIVNTVLRLAEEIGVKAVPLNTMPWVTETVSSRNYSVFRLNLRVTGTFSQLSIFLGRLESSEPKTLVIENLTVSKISDSSGGGGDAGLVPVNANVNIAVYSLATAAH